MEVLTKEECKKILGRIGFKLGVSPNLIATRLLTDQDKLSMLEGELSIASLEESVKVWMANGMPDYAHGSSESYESQKKRIQYEKLLREREELDEGLVYKKPFVDYRIVD